MKTFLRHLLVAVIPLVCGIIASNWFLWLAHGQGSCTALVGPVFAAKCHGRQLELQLLFQGGGTAVGCVIAAAIAAWLEHRRARVVQSGTPSRSEP